MIDSKGVDRFTIDVPDAVLEDLRDRLRRTRFPGEPEEAGWSYGASAPFVRRLVEYWLEEYDWRAVEARLNRLPQRMATIGDLRIHLLHERGSGPNPLPLVIAHGWPGSFVEFEAVVEPLAHPERFGGSDRDAFDVVVPSMPGFGWSSAPPGPITTRQMAAMWDELMTSVLGYPRYAAQGGDWGSLVATWLGVDFPTHLSGLHLNFAGLRPYTGEGSPPLTAEEQEWLERTQRAVERELGYQAIQGTKPQTLAHLLTDSPAGLAAWFVEKFHGWSDPAAGEPPFTLEQLVTNVMIYWVTASAGTASWPYTAVYRLGGVDLARDELVRAPTAFLATPNDLAPAPPDAWLARSYNLVRRTNLPCGGHFLAYERPQDFVEDVREFFRDCR
jgi:pimeloyl-ACP methyl ester carboxylesterase